MVEENQKDTQFSANILIKDDLRLARTERIFGTFRAKGGRMSS
jgi:hypothetical protein